MHHRSHLAFVALFVAVASTGCPEATCENDFDCAAGEVCGIDSVCSPRDVEPDVAPNDLPPTTTLDSEPDAVGNDASPTFTFSCDRASCTFQCSLDDAAFSLCTSPHTESDVADGAHSIRIRAIANELVDDTPAVSAFEIDTAAPVVTFDEQPPLFTDATSASIAFSCDESCTFRCALDLDATQAQPCTSPFGLTNLSENSHSFIVIAEDDAGNTTELSADWTVDATGPLVSIDTPPTDPSTADASVEFSANETPVTFACGLDAEPAVPCSSPFALTGLVAGAHSLSIIAEDQTGNAGAPTTVTWTVDAIAPSVVVSDSPPNPSQEVSAEFSFGCDEATCTFECAVDDAEFQTCSSPQTFDGLAVGTRSVQIRATDVAGNTSSPTTIQWTIERVYIGFAIGHIGIANDGTLWCFTDGTFCGLRTDLEDPPAPLAEPMQFGTKRNWERVSSNGFATCAYDTDGAAFCWGADSGIGMLGQPTAGGLAVETSIGLTDVTDISLNFLHGCALDSGRPYCWGSTGGGLVGGEEHASLPTLVDGTEAITGVEVASSTFTDFLVDDTGRLFRWGRRGTGATVNSTAVQERVGPVSLLWVSSTFMCLKDGGFLCGNAQVGDLTFVDGGSNWKKMIVIDSYGCGILPDDRVQCWPRNNFAARTNRGLVDVVELDADSTYGTCARTGDGVLHCWNANGAGDGTITIHTAPQTPAAE